MKYHVIKSDAVSCEFLGIAAEFDSWLEAMAFAMEQENQVYAARVLHNGHKIMFDAHPVSQGLVDADSYRAFRDWQRRQPVVNVWD